MEMDSPTRFRRSLIFSCIALLSTCALVLTIGRNTRAQEALPTETPASAAPGTEVTTPVVEIVATPEIPLEPIELQQPPVAAPETRVHVVQIGETLDGIAALHDITTRELAQLNRLTRSELLLAGQEIVLPETASEPMRLHRIEAGDTMAGVAAQYGVPLAQLERANQLPCADCLVAGQWLRIPTPGPMSALPEPFRSIFVSPPLPKQGEFIVVSVTTYSPLQSLVGTLAGRPLNFVQKGDAYLALTGVDALQNPGVYTVTLRGVTVEGQPSTLQGRLQVGAGSYGREFLTVNAKLEPLLAVDVNEEERVALNGIFARNFTGAQYWNGPLIQPIAGRIISFFGVRRTFNGGMLQTYHSGIDMPARQGVPIAAAASGKVIAVQNFPIRGNVVIIDHGRSVFTIYCHLSKFAVTPGDFVDAGDIIGYTGATGRILGPHLHFEAAVGGVTIDPLPLLGTEIP
jgi:murein DD-endopeptidase MepM/ murein hydrolase activator NlpD